MESSPICILRNKFDFGIKANVNLGSSFEYIWQDLHCKCYIHMIPEIGHLVPKKKILKSFTIYGHGGNLDHVAKTISYF